MILSVLSIQNKYIDSEKLFFTYSQCIQFPTNDSNLFFMGEQYTIMYIYHIFFISLTVISRKLLLISNTFSNSEIHYPCILGSTISIARSSVHSVHPYGPMYRVRLAMREILQFGVVHITSCPMKLAIILPYARNCCEKAQDRKCNCRLITKRTSVCWLYFRYICTGQYIISGTNLRERI